jgi:hypothetical protein
MTDVTADIARMQKAASDLDKSQSTLWQNVSFNWKVLNDGLGTTDNALALKLRYFYDFCQPALDQLVNNFSSLSTGLDTAATKIVELDNSIAQKIGGQ